MTLDEFMRRIGGVESGNPNATNPDSGAHGMYQIMPGNWASWAQQAGLPANAPQTAANQQRVAAHKMQQYYDQYGDWGAVAAAWYGGGVAAAKYLANKTDPYVTRKHGKYPSIAEYVARVLGGAAAKGAAKGAPQPTAAPTDTATPDAEFEQQRKTWDYQLASLHSIMAPGIATYDPTATTADPTMNGGV